MLETDSGPAHAARGVAARLASCCMSITGCRSPRQLSGGVPPSAPACPCQLPCDTAPTVSCHPAPGAAPRRLAQLSSTWKGALLLLMGPTTLWYMPTYSSIRAALTFMSPAHGKW